MGKSSTTNEVDDLDLVAFADDGGVEGDSLEDDEIVLDGHATGVDVEPGEQLTHRQRRRHLEPLAVQRDRQRCVWPWPPPPARPQLEGREAPFYRRCYDQRMPLDREAVLAWYRRNRERSRALFDLVSKDAYYRQPIALRHPIVFYEGHLPAFSFNTLVKKALGRPDIDARLEALFARGIDPHENAGAGAKAAWPSREEVHRFAEEADREVI